MYEYDYSWAQKRMEFRAKVLKMSNEELLHEYYDEMRSNSFGCNDEAIEIVRLEILWRMGPECKEE